jgi:hypothetical protein
MTVLRFSAPGARRTQSNGGEAAPKSHHAGGFSNASEFERISDLALIDISVRRSISPTQGNAPCQVQAVRPCDIR